MSNINLSGYSNTLALQEVDVTNLNFGHVIMMCCAGDYLAVEIVDFNVAGTIFVSVRDSGSVHTLFQLACLEDEFDEFSKKMLLGCYVEGKLYQVVMYEV